MSENIKRRLSLKLKELEERRQKLLMMAKRLGETIREIRREKKKL